jgi:hypothetical protein
VIPPEPTELERALAEPVQCPGVDASGPVSLARALVVRLTRRALDDGDVVACRELLRLCTEAAEVAAARTAIEEEQRRIDEEAQAANQREAEREAARAAEAEARAALERLAEAGAAEAGEEALPREVRMVALLGLSEAADAHGIGDLQAWVTQAAIERDPDREFLLDGEDAPDNPWEALTLMEAAYESVNGGILFAPWLVDAALARRRGPPLTIGEQALLALAVTHDGPGMGPTYREKLDKVLAGRDECEVLPHTPANGQDTEE